jgi:hypothetical protein
MNPARVSKRVVVYSYEFRNGKKFYRFVPSRYNKKTKKYAMIKGKKNIASTNPTDYELGDFLRGTFMQCQTNKR